MLNRAMRHKINKIYPVHLSEGKLTLKRKKSASNNTSLKRTVLPATVLLCQLLYWWDKKANEWLYKSRRELRIETGLTKREQVNGMKTLVRLDLIKTKIAGVPATTNYMLDEDKIRAMISDYSQLTYTRPTG